MCNGILGGGLGNSRDAGRGREPAAQRLGVPRQNGDNARGVETRRSAPAGPGSLEKVECPLFSLTVRECLVVWLPAWLPLARLALYLDELRASGDWTDEEIFEVDTRVRRFLTMIADKDE